MISSRDQFNHLSLREAREARGLSLAELAAKTDVTRQAISLFENGKKPPGVETLARIARELKFPVNYFLTTPERPALKGVINFRKLGSATKRDRIKSTIRERWTADLVKLLAESVNLPKVNLPDFGVVDFDQLSDDEIDDYAQETRRFWGLGLGPISNLTLLLENNGVVVSRINLSTAVDAFSCWQEDVPIILLGNKLPFARGRFDCGHELAHLILHKAVSDEHQSDPETFKLIEKQAHKFGAALLVPREALAKELYSTSLESFISLKKRWGLSVQALVYRAASLGLISQNQSQYLFRQISGLGYRKVEPLDKETPAERPSLLPRAVRLLVENNILQGHDFIEELNLFPEDLSEITGIEPAFFQDSLRVAPIALRRA